MPMPQAHFDANAKWALADVLLEVAQMDTLIDAATEKYDVTDPLDVKEMRERIQEQIKTFASVVAYFL